MRVGGVTNLLQTSTDEGVAESYWRSLRYFSIYRLVAGAVLLTAMWR